jgi:NAD(P)-dependent dehydrogenase (short-subunit alcohol dehydrogenase family)
MGKLEGKIAIITAAASGIGRASAIRFAADGATVVVVDIVVPAMDAVVAEINASGGTAVAYAADVTSPTAMQELVDFAVARFGRLDVFFANAGGQLPVPTLDVTPEEYRRVIALNLDSLFYGITPALRVMVEQKSGVLLATSSGAGLNAVKNLAVYGAAKAGVVNFMRNIAVEYGHYGIRACTISPGPMITPGMRRWVETLPGGLEQYAKQVPTGRLGRPEDIANAAAFLASEDASYISGVVLSVDGAIHAKFAAPEPT